MQTFLPYPDVDKSVSVLDQKRLGKQRLEAYQLLRTNLFPHARNSYRNHPASRMWRGYEAALCFYGLAACREWMRRGFVDNLHMELETLATEYKWLTPKMPPWFGDERFHSSHRAALLWKAPAIYGAYGWTETPCEDYFWPVVEVPDEEP